METRNIVVS